MGSELFSITHFDAQTTIIPIEFTVYELYFNSLWFRV